MVFVRSLQVVLNDLPFSEGDTTERGQIAITDDDIRAIPTVLANPDYIIFGAENRQHNKVIVYAKNMSDGSTLYVEEKRTRSKHLAANTLYKMTTAGDANMLSHNPTLYAQGDRSTIDIVDVKAELVKQNLNDLPFSEGDTTLCRGTSQAARRSHPIPWRSRQAQIRRLRPFSG